MREYIKEQDFLGEMESTVLPYLAARETTRTVAAEDGKLLFTVHYKADAPSGTVVLLHGFSENAEKYREFIYYLLREGLSVLTFDQRGHGRSYRSAAAGISHIDRFDQYVSDLEALLEAWENSLFAPLYLFAHSMGGAVAMLYLQKHGNVFKKAVLSAPMIDLQYRGVTRAACVLACGFCVLTGRAKKPVFISKKDYENEPFEVSLALSRARFTYLQELRRSDPILSGGAPSYRWSLAALGVRKSILQGGAPERVDLPVLILAAEHEQLVSPEAQRRLAHRLPRATLRVVQGSKHEILLANDEILHPILEDIMNFLKD